MRIRAAAVILLMGIWLVGCEQAADKPDGEETPMPVITVVEQAPTESVTEFPENEESEEAPDLDSAFYSAEISDELFERMKGLSYKDDCTLPREDLRYLHLLYVDFDGNTAEGEMVCNYRIADALLDSFKELYENGYQIEKIRLVDEYDADDERSMADDNTSCFNFRFVSHSTTPSNHGYGLAFDINPLYNPYVKTVKGQLSVEPANAGDYVDREADFAHKIDQNDLAYKVFTEHGFSWGGEWKNSKDYQHFEIPKQQIDSWYP